MVRARLPDDTEETSEQENTACHDRRPSWRLTSGYPPGAHGSILEGDPGCARAHAALAAYYEKQGDAEKAAAHRRGPAPADKETRKPADKAKAAP